jgi:ribonuclease-3
MNLQLLQTRLGYTFRDPNLLQQALTHRSHSSLHNERLEFLGDSILNCVVASILFDRFNALTEGDLSRLRANLVKQQTLYEIAQKLELSQFLRLGEGELKSGGFRRPSILADTLEALLGAIFLDSGFDAARSAIRAFYIPLLDSVDPRTLGKDAKTLLQEFLQSKKIALPTYNVVATHGAAHSQEFAPGAPASRPRRAWRWTWPSRRCRKVRRRPASPSRARRSSSWPASPPTRARTSVPHHSNPHNPDHPN